MSNPYSIHIDQREKALKKHFRNHLINKKNKVFFECLDIGDIQIKKNSQIIILIERKTVQDLAMSIKDGRYKEQKFRIQQAKIPKCIYLIEGDLEFDFFVKIQGMTVSTLLSSLWNTMLRDNLMVYKTQSIEETEYFLEKLFEKVTNYSIFDTLFNQETGPKDYSEVIKVKKKKYNTPYNCFIAQCASIPGISRKKGVVIANNYSTMYDLCSSLIEYKNNDDLDNHPLCKCSYQIKNGKERMLGVNNVNKLVKYLIP